MRFWNYKFDKMNTIERLQEGTIQDYEDYNEWYDADSSVRYSEASKYDMDAMRLWVSIRDRLQYEDDRDAEGDWRTLQIAQCPCKYGTYYIFIDIKNNKWRIKDTASEFYGYRPPKFELSQLSK